MRALMHGNRRRQRGLSLVELMVGLTVGLFIVAAAAMMATGQLGDNRRLMLETQLNQELRAAMDLINRDVRRASGWSDAASGVWRSNNQTVEANPNATITSGEGGASINYAYVSGGNATPAGFRLRDNALQMLVGEAWQTITDTQTIRIETLTMDVQEHKVDLAGYCLNGCTFGACPALTVRTVDVTLVAQAPTDAAIQRRLTSTVRLPNDRVTGACP